MHGCRHGIAVVNGTVALRIALLAAGIRAEDEVIVPPYTFVATATAVIEANAIPVFADIDLHTFNLDPAAVAAAITPRTKAIIPVHFAGQPADMDAIMALAAGSRHPRPRGRRPRARRVVPGPSRRLARTHRVVLVSVEQEPHGGRGGHHHDERRCAGGGVPLDSQLRARARRRVVRAPRGLRQLPARRIPGGGAQLPARSPRGADRDARSQRPAPRRRAWRRCRAFIRSGVLPNARGTAITCSCCGSTPAEFGASRAAVLDALAAEGIPCSAGYGYSLPDQPLFRNKAFGPYPAAGVRAGSTTARRAARTAT